MSFTRASICFLIFSLAICVATARLVNKTDSVSIPLFKNNPLIKNAMQGLYTRRTTPCTCGIFLEGQLVEGNTVLPEANAAFVKEMEYSMLPCGLNGNKLCTNKCLDMVTHRMAVAGPLICASIDRDCYREKAYLFIKNCDSSWRPTGFSAGKEFCCIGGIETKCIKTLASAASHVQPISVLSGLLSGGSKASNRRSIPDFLFDVADGAVGVVSDILGVRQIK